MTLSDLGFRDYESLKNLDISGTEMFAFKSSWFTRKSIEVLNASGNLLKALRKDDTKFFTQLRIFNASFNEIKMLETGTFLEAKKLEIISLSHNQLTNPTFENLDNLKQLYLKGNSITMVNWINLIENKFSDWLTIQVRPISYFKLPKLEDLNLAENDIAAIGDRSFATLESLKYLNLSNNKLPHIGPNFFTGASRTKLEEVDFSFNLITIVYQMSLQ